MDRERTQVEKRDVLRFSNEESHRLTREYIQTALIQLMGKKPFEKITITEIIERSGVSRSGFYRNYSSKEDVIRDLCKDISDSLTEYLAKGERTEDLYQFFYTLFSKIKENEWAFHLFLQANIPMVFPAYELALETVRPAQTPEEYYRWLAMEGAYAKVLLGWFHRGMKESVEYMAEFCCGLSKSLR